MPDVPTGERHAKRYLRGALEVAGLRVTHAETIPGPFPIGYVQAEA